ncbi:MAG TPA: Rieske (2Fe-2S) protein [Thermoanaerobaculia bacterium]
MADGADRAESPGVPRRSLLAWLSGAGLLAALAAGYGTFAAFLARFLYPAGPANRGWIFVRELGRIRPGESFPYVTPGGETVNVARLGARDDVGSFIALSSTCPHLGCQVRWEAQSNRFVCPCHGGVFLPDGTAIAGPPGKAGQRLVRFDLKVDGGLLFIDVPFAATGRSAGLAVLPAAAAEAAKCSKAKGAACAGCKGVRA